MKRRPKKILWWCGERGYEE